MNCAVAQETDLLCQFIFRAGGGPIFTLASGGPNFSSKSRSLRDLGNGSRTPLTLYRFDTVCNAQNIFSKYKMQYFVSVVVVLYLYCISIVFVLYLYCISVVFVRYLCAPRYEAKVKLECDLESK